MIRPYRVSGTYEIDEPWILLNGVHYLLNEPLTVTYTGTVYPGYKQTWKEPGYNGDLEIEVLLNDKPCPENTIFVNSVLDKFENIDNIIKEHVIDQGPPDDFDEDSYRERRHFDH